MQFRSVFWWRSIKAASALWRASGSSQSFETIIQKFQRLIDVNILLYQTSISHVGTNSLASLHKSKACETDTLALYRRFSTEVNMRREITDQFTQPHTMQGPGQKISRSKKRIKCSLWTLSCPCKRSGPHLLSLSLRKTELFAFASTTASWMPRRFGIRTQYHIWKMN